MLDDLYPSLSLTAFIIPYQYLNIFLMILVVILTKVIFLMSQHLKDLCNSVNQYFPKYKCMLQNHSWVIDPFKDQNRLKNVR